ncbi:acyl-CoA-binding protein [Flavobacterium pallidum]|uniref:Phosphatidylserine decarboxylase n=1 Tax=Flavobacterium pallidum TaxID=2172098 RepID=A0A2S1SK04_9FLAO|nr:acyl-CoA-binding protein [Flavobacterium pallidum]AWI26696.1 phosphatidylserine decarboxylase [Flavobacterium pallidum]
MEPEGLNKRFNDAVEIAGEMTQSSLPQDIQLRLYAFYKQATFGTIDNSQHASNFDLRNAFKTNAWMQISHLSADEAKEAYIELIHSLNK